jgi:streptomycin 6-kinase
MADVPPGIPRNLARRIVEIHGREGETWLRNFPALIESCERRWSLNVGPPFSGLSYNYVAPAVRTGGEEVVLKLGVPDREHFTEIEALRLFDGRGIVRLLDADGDQSVLLLERLRPGTPLAMLEDDDQATAIAAGVMQQLWRPAPDEHDFPTVIDWAGGLRRLRARFDGGVGPFPARLIEAAEVLFGELIDSMGNAALLHGDLHHHNILSAERQPWLAIDPKGVIGEPAYEVGALLRNPMPELLQMPWPDRILARRLDILTERLGFERERLVAWGMAQAVLSAWWSFEDHGHGWEDCIALATRLVEFSV